MMKISCPLITLIGALTLNTAFASQNNWKKLKYIDLETIECRAQTSYKNKVIITSRDMVDDDGASIIFEGKSGEITFTAQYQAAGDYASATITIKESGKLIAQSESLVSGPDHAIILRGSDQNIVMSCGNF